MSRSRPTDGASVALVVVGVIFLFARLGHYALWDDEAGLALVAKGVWATGDTSAVVGHNVVACRNGYLLRNLRDRSNPPLPAYLLAPFVGLGADSAAVARFPFALLGLAAIGIGLWWMRKSGIDRRTWSLVVLGVLGNVSLFLYCRQARYYAIALAASLALTYLYLNWNRRKPQLVAMALLSIAIFAAHYITFVALWAALLVDYFAWGRKTRPLRPADGALLIAPQIVLCGLIAAIWNPFATGVGTQSLSNHLLQRLMLIFWNLRDLNRCEFGVGILLLAAPLLYFRNRNPWLLRGPLAILVYCVAIGLISPQIVKTTSVADVRYLLPLIPLCIVIEVLVIKDLARSAPWAAVVIALVAFHSNILNGGMLFSEGIRSTSAAFVGELIAPPGDPFTVTARWINQHVESGESIAVQPDFMVYPLMFHAPQAVYAWQLEGDNRDPQFANLPAIHFQGREMPDYLVLFGPVVQAVAPLLQQWETRGIRYERATTLDFFWQDRHRPELFWRTFKPITAFDRRLEAIYILRRAR